jgi:hypothetical protein
MLPITDRRRLLSELVPNLDRDVPAEEWLPLLEIVVRRLTGGIGNEFSFSGSVGSEGCDCKNEPGGARCEEKLQETGLSTMAGELEGKKSSTGVEITIGGWEHSGCVGGTGSTGSSCNTSRGGTLLETEDLPLNEISVLRSARAQSESGAECDNGVTPDARALKVSCFG